MRSLAVRATAGLAQLAVIMLALVFASAGSLGFWQGWLYWAVFTACAATITIDLMRRDQALLERRLRAGPSAERRPGQRVIQAAAGVMFVALLVGSCLDYRFGGSDVPPAVVAVADVLVAVGFAIVGAVFRANTFTSATIEIASDHRVITIGPYRIVRHPMYAGATVLLAATPLALGSWWALVIVPPFIAVLAWRLLDEERVLVAELPGYAAYRSTTRARLVPGIW